MRGIRSKARPRASHLVRARVRARVSVRVRVRVRVRDRVRGRGRVRVAPLQVLLEEILARELARLREVIDPLPRQQLPPGDARRAPCPQQVPRAAVTRR